MLDLSALSIYIFFKSEYALILMLVSFYDKLNLTLKRIYPDTHSAITTPIFLCGCKLVISNFDFHRIFLYWLGMCILYYLCSLYRIFTAKAKKERPMTKFYIIPPLLVRMYGIIDGKSDVELDLVKKQGYLYIPFRCPSDIGFEQIKIVMHDTIQDRKHTYYCTDNNFYKWKPSLFYVVKKEQFDDVFESDWETDTEDEGDCQSREASEVENGPEVTQAVQEAERVERVSSPCFFKRCIEGPVSETVSETMSETVL